MNPSHIAIRNPASVFILIVMIVTLGVVSYRNLPREAAPDIQIPLLIVTLPFPGASPEDVESLVTRKVEIALQNVDNLKEIKSTSAEGAVTITLEFALGFDVDDARVKVREKLDGIRPELPADVEDPIINEINTSERPMIIINLAGEVGLMALKDVAEDLKDGLEAIPGVLEVRRAGGLEKEIKVQVDPQKLQYYGVSLNQLSNAIDRENTNLPGGTLEMGPTKYLIRVPGEFVSPEEINDVVVAAPGQLPIYVRELAQVVDGYKDVTSRSRLDGVESVSLSVTKRSGQNLLEIRERIQALVKGYQARYAGRIRFTMLADQGEFIERIVSDLENNIISGFLLVFVVLLVVMGGRNAFFVATAIPLSFLLTLLVLQALGFTLNFVVLFALILALGMLVDNAVVVVENIFRHLQAGKSRIEAARVGITEVAVPVTTSTITTLVAFGPVIFMPGIVGQFMTYLPQTLIIALSSSLFVALIVSPVLCSTMMRRKGALGGQLDEVENLGDHWLLKWYEKSLRYALARRKRVLVAVCGAFVVIFGLYVATTLRSKGVEFFPSSEPRNAIVTVNAPAGSTLDVSDGYVLRLEDDLHPLRPYMTSFVSNVGQRSGMGGESAGGTTSHLSHLSLDFPDWQHWKRRPSEVIRDMRDMIEAPPGAEVRINQQKMGPPTGAAVNIELRGEKLQEMMEGTERIRRSIAGTPGLINLQDNLDQSRPEIRVMIDREKTARLGLSTRDVALTVRTAFNGRKVSEFREGKEEHDIVVRLAAPYRRSPTDLEGLFLMTPGGEQVPLNEVASVTMGPAYGTLRHIGLDRVVTISADAAEGTPGPVLLQRVQKRLEGLELPESLRISYTGENTDREESQSFLAQSFLMALFLIFLVLVTQFNSFATPFIIMSSVVLSLMGVFLGLMVHGRPFSVVMGGIGVISLAGIVVNNAIVLMDFIGQLRKRGYDLEQAVVLAGMVRLRPVLLTAITTILGLVPIVMGMDINFFRWPMVVFGSEGGTFWMPMALAVIYGLAVATVLTLIVVPVLYTTIELGKTRLGAMIRRNGEDTPREAGKAALG